MVQFGARQHHNSGAPKVVLVAGYRSGWNPVHHERHMLTTIIGYNYPREMVCRSLVQLCPIFTSATRAMAGPQSGLHNDRRCG